MENKPYPISDDGVVSITLDLQTKLYTTAASGELIITDSSLANVNDAVEAYYAAKPAPEQNDNIDLDSLFRMPTVLELIAIGALATVVSGSALIGIAAVVGAVVTSTAYELHKDQQKR